LWPDDYDQWKRAALPLLKESLKRFFVRCVKKGSLVRKAVPDLMAKSARKAFARMDAWRRYRGLIADEGQFRGALLVMANAEVRRAFLEHEYVALRLQNVAPLQRRVLLLHDTIALSFQEIAAVLKLPENEVRRAYLEGFDALRELL
jgi:DNA-directed RNA polymerase specialized sigma24 family protein